MIRTAHDLARVLDQDLSTACRDLDEARIRQACKGTPSNRAAVAAARARIDAFLDMYLQAGRPAC